MKSIFREYDIRGIFEKELNETSVKKIGYFLGEEIKKISDTPIVSIGYDARTHSPVLEKWLTSGFNKAGVEVLTMGMVPTPTNYFSNFVEFDGKSVSGSVMITGSHNPPEYNGFKITVGKQPFFGDMIYALGDKVVASDLEIEDNTTSSFIDAKERYIDYLTKEFSDLKNMEGKFVFDGGNGVASIGLEPILKNLGISHKFLYAEPDGTFPNHHPDPSEEENLVDVKKVLTDEGFDYGFAFDGDSDRIAILDKHYNYKGDILAIFFARHIENPTVIGEVKCSQIMYDEVEKIGKGIMYKTGHSNLKVKIAETKASFAAEVSGHIFFNDRYFGYDDAIYSALRALELIKANYNFKEEFEKLPKVYSTEELKVKTTEDKKFAIIDSVKEALKNPPADFPKIRDVVDIDGVRVIFEDGWGLIRASNTTPVLVTRFEGTSPSSLETIQNAMEELLSKVM